MFALCGFVALFASILIGMWRASIRSKKEDEHFYLSIIKWILSGFAILAILCLIEPESENTYTNVPALVCLSIGMTLAVIILNIAEVIIKAKNLKDEKIKEYNKQKDKWN